MSEDKLPQAGRIDRAMSQEVSKAILVAMGKRGITASKIAQTLQQTPSAISRKLKGLVNWAISDLLILAQTYGDDWIGDLTQIAVSSIKTPAKDETPAAPNRITSQSMGAALVNAVSTPRMTIAVFLDTYAPLLNEEALKAADKCNASFPDDQRSLADWMRVLRLMVP